MDATFETTLIASLDALDRGEPLEDILRHHPTYAAELRPILVTASGLSELDLAPPAVAAAASRQRFLAEAAETSAGFKTSQNTAAQTGTAQTRTAQIKVAQPLPSRAPEAPGRFAWLGRPALTMAAMAVAVIMMIVVSLSASASALPGDKLYTLKRATERIQIALVSDGTSQAALHDTFNQRRIDEANALIAAGRAGDVDFLGVAEPAGEGSWRIAGVLAQVDNSTQILGDLGPGELVHVRGHTAGGQLHLGTVICLDDLPDWTPASGPPPPMTIVPWPTPAPAATRPSSAPDRAPAASPASTQPPIATPMSATHPAPAAPPAGNAGAAPGVVATPDDDDGGDEDKVAGDDDKGGDDGHGSGKDDDDKPKDDDNSGSGKDDGGKGKDDDGHEDRGSDKDDKDKGKDRGD